MRKIVTLLPVLMLLCTLAFGQNRTISGQVRDEKGDPIPFATILETGTRNATQADANGVFSLRISGSRLTISASGHETQSITVSGNAVNATLTTSNSQLNEVVVTTAFGIKRAQRITPYSSQVLNDQQLNIIPHTDVNSALAGKVAGVQFRGQSPIKLDAQGSLRIRGGLALTGDKAPLYIVDGTPTNSFDINPDDIADLTVLKGANATALFGEQAVGGAIVITTKKGTKGSSIEASEGITLDKVYILPKYQNLYAGGASYDLYKFTWQPGMPDAWKPLDGKYYPDYTDDASWGPRMVGQEYIPWYAWIPGTADAGKTASLVPQPNNARDFWSTGVTSNTNVSFSKASEGASVRVSYTNNSIKGMLPNTNSARNTLFATTSINLNNHFTTGADVTFSNQTIHGFFSDAYANQSSGSFSSWFHRDLDMKKLEQYRALKTPIGTYASWNLSANPSSPSVVNSVYKGNYWYNFYTYFDLLNNNQNRDRLYGDAYLTYTLNNHFKVRGTVRKNSISTLYENITPTEIETSGAQTGDKASYATGQTKANEMNYELIASYNQTFINKLNISLNAGANDYRYSFQTAEMATKNGLNVPGLYAISNSKDQPSLTNTRQKKEVRSVFGSGDIEWNRIIDVTFALRNDWYSVLFANKNSLLSPSVGGSFFFSDFTKNSLPWLSYGKIFGSWGKKPITYLDAYQTNFAYSINPNKWNGNFLTSVPNQGVDSALAGALVSTIETGIDLKFAHNRFGINVLYYDETSKNAPFPVSISGYSGFTSLLENVSLIKRRGIEVVLDAHVMTRKDFTWDITKTFGYLIDNPVVETDKDGNKILIATGAAFSGIVPPKVYQVKGEQWGQLIGTAIKRVDGVPVLDPNTGAYITEQNHDFGSVVPKVTGGLINTLTYKNLTLNFNIDYQVGGKFFSLSEMWGTYSGLLAPTAATNDKGMNVRDDVSLGGGVHVVGVSSVDLKTKVDTYVDAQTYFHGLGGGNAIADPFLHSLTYVKLREVSLGYNLPVGKWGVRWIKGINASLLGRNLLLIYRETNNFDPSEISNVQGEDGQLPGTRSVGVNFKFNF